MAGGPRARASGGAGQGPGPTRWLLRDFEGCEDRALGRGEAAVDADAGVFLLFALDVAEGVELRDHVVA